jgi:hypothetical protein
MLASMNNRQSVGVFVDQHCVPSHDPFLGFFLHDYHLLVRLRPP